MKRFSLNEICDYLEKKQITKEEQEKYSQQGLRCSFSTGRGAGGFSVRMLLIPESIQVIVSPAACGRHADFELMLAGIKNRFYRIRLSEKEIVSGTAVKMVCDEVLKLVESLENKPKALSLCITCVDALLHTDYSVLGRKLKEQYGIRFCVARMFPFLADSMKSHFELLLESVYELVPVSKEIVPRKAINIIGKTESADPDTDFYQVLQKAGYEVQEVHACKTLEEYDRLGEACLNVVLTRHSLHAAKMMKKKHGIPYIEFYECLNPEEMKQNYKKLEEALGCELDVEEYYQRAWEKVNRLRELMQGKQFATGGGLEYNTAKFAYDWCRLGFPLKYVHVDQIQKSDLEYYQWMKENSPETYVYLVTDTSMMRFVENPDTVDYSAGIQFGLVKKIKNVTMLKFKEEPYDFETLIRALDEFEAALCSQEQKASAEEPNMFARNWSTYTEE